MWNVSLVFQRSVFALATLSALILALAEGELFPNVLTFPLAMVAYYLTVHKKSHYLPNVFANLLALLALFLFGGEWARGEVTADIESVMLARLVSGTHLLVYLMWIVLFQRKTNRQYWWMLALSLLQIAVGSVLTEAGLYGALLFAYLIGALWTLSLFTLHVAQEKLIRPTAADNQAAMSPQKSEVAHGKRETAHSHIESILKSSHIVSENHRRGWRQQAIDLRFIVGVCGTAIASLGVALFFFLLVPRMDRLPIVQAGGVSRLAMRLTGFSDEVRLGSMGQILESTERVLFVRVYDADGNEMDVAQYATSLGYDEPLFRGAVLGTYRHGRWTAGRLSREPADPSLNRARKDQVRQVYRLSLPNTKHLFAIHPIKGFKVRTEGNIGYQHFSAMLLKQDGRRKHPSIEYTIYPRDPMPGSGPPAIQIPKAQTPRDVTEAIMFSRIERRRRRMFDQCRHLPNENGRLSRLERLAKRIAGFDDVPARRPSNREMARRLVAHLRDSGEYGYSLNSSIVDTNADPVEDFLFNRKQGHCEYYAASLALMLRAVEIPSRLVNGFKGGQVNRLTGEFYVEQRHAHAWVEALIDDGWETLDATPAAARSESVAGLAPAVNSWDDLINMFKDQWSTSFVSMNKEKQKELFYEPLKNSLSATMDALKGEASNSRGGQRSLRRLLASPENWFSWQGAVATAVMLTLLSAVIWGLRRLLRRRRTGPARDHKRQAREQIQVEFYERFRALCRSVGLIRGETQTEREFLFAVDQTLQAKLAAAGMQSVPGELVHSFYEVRFGGQQIDSNLQRHIDAQLSALEQLTAEPRGKQ